MNAEWKDKPESGSIGEMLSPRVLDLVLKSGAAFDGQLAGDVIEALAVHLAFLVDGVVDSREGALRVAMLMQLVAKRAVERANNLPPTGGVH